MTITNLDELYNKKKFPKHEKNDIFTYKGIEFPAQLVNKKPDSLKVSDFLDAIEAMHGAEIDINKNSLKMGLKIYEKDKDVFYESFLKWYKEIGNINCYKKLMKPEILNKIEEAKTVLSEKFREQYHRVPAVIDSMAVISALYNIPEQDIIDSFSIERMRSAKELLSPSEAVILLLGAKDERSLAVFTNEAPAKYAAKCYCEGYNLKANNVPVAQKYFDAGNWIAAHALTKGDILKKIAKQVDEINISEDTTVESIKSQLENVSSKGEVQKIERQYKHTGFKFRDCVFDLKFSDTVSGNYRMEILRPGDTRMVYLGELTHCCQKLYDVGESAMMHGLLHPKAGFWAMSDKTTSRIVAQAEIWEKEGDSDTLVFDNIEFANDCEISQYREAIADWLRESPYKNIYMGTGYNQLAYAGNFRQTEPLHPGITAYEAYVISHEEESEAIIFNSEEEAQAALDEGRVTYYDYIYCDSERNTVVLKENDVLEPYFTMTRDEFEQQQELSDDEEYDEEYDEYNEAE